MWRTQFQKSRRASNTCDEFCCYHALDARVVSGRPVGRREAASHAGMLARSPQIAAGESSRRQKPWARKLLASMRVTNVSRLQEPQTANGRHNSAQGRRI